MMKFKILSLLLTAGLALAACDADNSNDKATSPDDKNKSEVDSSEANKSDAVKKNEAANVTKDSNANDEDDADDAVKDDEKASSSKDSEDKMLLSKDEITATPDDIIKQLQNDNKQGKLTNIDFENDNGQWVYKIGQNENNKNMVYTYSMKDKKLLSSKEDAVAKDEQTFNYDKMLSFDEALTKAQNKTSKDAKIKEWTLESKDNIPVYEFKLMDGSKEKTVMVDPYEGETHVEE
ncbi:PepSY domain-containing protein [Macrococcus equipercicus]|nr:PepSY domain-containing protein [Macrococcus equipercicus]UTH13469.1 PepSY domain-containing protein [Macrococcus equipercicus]